MATSSPASAALRAVTDVVLGLAGEPALEPVLERLVHAVRDLVGARYAALGIPDEDGTGFDRFITSGMSDELIEAIGPLPRTHGLLAAMLTDPEPYRTDDIRVDPRFEWWPEAHPRMRSFLGVPLLFKGDIVGAFYLTDKDGGFGDADVELVRGLTAHAAVVIENARLFDASRERSIADDRPPPALRLGTGTERQLLRVAEEALSNAVRHSEAGTVTVRLAGDGEAVVLSVADDGRARILVLTSFASADQVLPALRAGAAGYLLKDAAPSEVEAAIRAVHRGEGLLDPAVTATVLAEVARPGAADPTTTAGAGGAEFASLTPREREVLGLLGRGLPNAAIARELFVAEKTVKTHVSSILAKLRLSDRTQAALYASRLGLS